MMQRRPRDVLLCLDRFKTVFLKVPYLMEPIKNRFSFFFGFESFSPIRTVGSVPKPLVIWGRAIKHRAFAVGHFNNPSHSVTP